MLPIEVPIFYGAWYEASGKKAGQGQLSQEDFFRLRKVYLGYNCLLLLSQEKAAAANNIGFQYLGENCLIAVAGGQIYSVNGSLNLPSVMHVTQHEIKELIVKSNAARARRIAVPPQNHTNDFSHLNLFKEGHMLNAAVVNSESRLKTRMVNSADKYELFMLEGEAEVLKRFKLVRGQTRQSPLTSRSLWFEREGNLIGRGDLDATDFCRIASLLGDGDAFLVTGKSAEFPIFKKRMDEILTDLRYVITGRGIFLVNHVDENYVGERRVRVGGVHMKVIGIRKAEEVLALLGPTKA